MKECLNNYNEEDIEKFFGESDESMKKCNKCKNLIYENGTLTCSFLSEENNDEQN
jgi:hypothetical protein